MNELNNETKNPDIVTKAQSVFSRAVYIFVALAIIIAAVVLINHFKEEEFSQTPNPEVTEDNDLENTRDIVDNALIAELIKEAESVEVTEGDTLGEARKLFTIASYQRVYMGREKNFQLAAAMNLKNAYLLIKDDVRPEAVVLKDEVGLVLLEQYAAGPYSVDYEYVEKYRINLKEQYRDARTEDVALALTMMYRVEFAETAFSTKEEKAVRAYSAYLKSLILSKYSNLINSQYAEKISTEIAEEIQVNSGRTNTIYPHRNLTYSIITDAYMLFARSVLDAQNNTTSVDYEQEVRNIIERIESDSLAMEEPILQDLAKIAVLHISISTFKNIGLSGEELGKKAQEIANAGSPEVRYGYELIFK